MAEKDQRLVGFSTDQLREMWDVADDTPGERVDGLHKSEISLEITNRVNAEKLVPVVKPIQVQMPEVGGLVVEQPTHQPQIFSDLEVRGPKADVSEQTELQTPTEVKVYPPDNPMDALNGTEHRRR